MAKGLCLKPRGSIGRAKNGTVPEGVNWDAFLGPAPYRPLNKNRFHYKWHWFWDSDQETPNIQHLEFEYEDGSIF